jgi:hypothetical protein
MILFTEFNDVIHPEYFPGTVPARYRANTDDFSCLPQLERLLREFPLLQIVISSTWRLRRSLEELRTFFSPDIAERIIGITPELPSMPYRRQREIETWIAQHAPGQPWVALDNDRRLYDPSRPNVFFTDALVGLDLDTARRFHQWISTHLKQEQS